MYAELNEPPAHGNGPGGNALLQANFAVAHADQDHLQYEPLGIAE